MFIRVIDGNKNQMVLDIKKTQKIKWKGRKLIHFQPELKNLIPSYFKVGVDGELIQCNEEIYQKTKEEYSLGESIKEVGDNEMIYKKEQNVQKLSNEKIEELKKTENSNDLIKIIQSNNKNFEKRNIFSKKKYLDRKNKKYNIRLFIENCDIMNLNNYFFNLFKDYIFLREDSICYFLNHIQITGKEKIFLSENCCGLICSYLLKRAKDENKIYCFDPFAKEINYKKQKALKFMKLKWKVPQFIQQINQKNLDEVDKLDYILLACESDPAGFLSKLDAKMNLNGKVVVYSRFYESAKGVYEFMLNNSYLEIKVRDYFCREYQIFPGRTHPTMTGNSSSGFFITGIKIFRKDKK